MKPVYLILLIFINTVSAKPLDDFGDRYALIIAGAGGEEGFTKKYFELTRDLRGILLNDLQYNPENMISLFENTDYDSTLQVDGIANSDGIRNAFRQLGDKMKSEDQLFVFLVGHGSFDGKWGKFNIVGPDLKDIEYGELLAKLPTKQVVFVNTSSASGPFIKKLSGEGKVIITATKSGQEHFETNFADFFLEALRAKQSDINKDKRVSVKEAFEFARASQDNWFEENKKLRAEHPLLDDNGDGKGSQRFEKSGDGTFAGSFYFGPISEQLQETAARVRLGEATELDKLRLEKVRLQNEITVLKNQKGRVAPDKYFEKLEALLIRLATVNQQIKAEKTGGE